MDVNSLAPAQQNIPGGKGGKGSGFGVDLASQQQLSGQFRNSVSSPYDYGKDRQQHGVMNNFQGNLSSPGKGKGKGTSFNPNDSAGRRGIQGGASTLWIPPGVDPSLVTTAGVPSGGKGQGPGKGAGKGFSQTSLWIPPATATPPASTPGQSQQQLQAQSPQQLLQLQQLAQLQARQAQAGGGPVSGYSHLHP